MSEKIPLLVATTLSSEHQARLAERYDMKFIAP